MNRNVMAFILILLIIFLDPSTMSRNEIASNQYDSKSFAYQPISKQFSLSQEEDCSVTCDFILPVLNPDSIPSIDNPKFVSHDQVSKLKLDDIVLGIEVNGMSYAFPLDILDWHEIVNAELGDRSIAVTYCPLTATGIPFDRHSIGGGEIGVSGKLYENNLVFYDRDTKQYWLQMYGEVIQGDSSSLGQKITQIPIIETTWRAWQALNPETLVLDRDTGIYDELQYERSAYPGYDSRESIIFRSSYNEDHYPDQLYSRKNRSLILTINNITILFPYLELSKYSVVNELIGTEPVVVVYDELNRLAIPFSRVLSDGSVLTNFKQEPVGEIKDSTFQLPVFTDSTGTKWNFKGEAFKGPHEGEKLKQLSAYTGYWFALTVLFPTAKIFPHNATISPTLNQYDWTDRSIDSEKDENISLIYLAISFPILLIVIVLIIYRFSKSITN